MSRTPARFRQADIARAIKAVQQTGADMRVCLLPDGSIVIDHSQPDSVNNSHDKPLAARPEYRL